MFEMVKYMTKTMSINLVVDIVFAGMWVTFSVALK